MTDLRGRISDLALSDRTLYVLGEFTRIGGQGRAGFAALDAVNGAVSGWRAETAGVRSMAASAGSLYVAGTFT